MKKQIALAALLCACAALQAQAGFIPEDCSFFDSTCEWRNKNRAKEHAEKMAREAERLEWVKRKDPNWQESERIRAEEAVIRKLPEAERFRLWAERKKAEAEKKEADRLRSKQEYEARQKVERVADEARKLAQQEAMDLAKKRRQDERDQQAASDARQEQLDRIAATKAAAKEADRKTRCLDDYKNPKIGMPITRWQDCITAMRVTGQVNKADGVATQYVGGGYWANVMNGLVVAWGR
jgi:hypothetical protein